MASAGKRNDKQRKFISPSKQEWNVVYDKKSRASEEKKSLNVNPSLGRKQTTEVDGNKLNSYEEREWKVARRDGGEKALSTKSC